MTDAPKGFRDNDPFNMNYVAAIKWQGELSPDGRFNTFDTMADGIRAGVINTCNHVLKDGCAPTVRALIGMQAPPNENNTEAYIATVSTMLHVTPNSTIDIRDFNTMKQYAIAVSTVELGAEWARKIPDADFDAGVIAAFQHLYEGV